MEAVKTDAISDALSLARPLTDDELAQLNSVVGELYGNFTAKVAEGRKFDAAHAEEVAAWVEGYGTVTRLRRELAVRTLPEQLEVAREWFADQKGNDARFLAASLVPAWVRLRDTLRKGGLVE